MTLDQAIYATLTKYCVDYPKTSAMDLLKALDRARFQLTEAVIDMEGVERHPGWKPQR